MIGYLRVSTLDQNYGVDVQRAAIEFEASGRGWEVHWVIDRGETRKNANRLGLTEALIMLDRGEVDALVVSKLDRLSRSLLDFASLMARAQTNGWNLVALDLGIDLSTPAGEFLASVMASAAQWERRIIGQRTREALAQKKAAGVRLGPPRRLPDQVAEQIVGLRASGLSWARVALALNELAVPTALTGRQWYPSTARSAVLAYERDLARAMAPSR